MDPDLFPGDIRQIFLVNRTELDTSREKDPGWNQYAFLLALRNKCIQCLVLIDSASHNCI